MFKITRREAEPATAATFGRSGCKSPTLVVVVVAAAAALSIFGLPYFSQLGHPLWSILVYLFFAVLFLYGRNNRLAEKYQP